MTPQNNPTINPAKTSNKVCCFTMIRAVPSIPDSKMKKQSQVDGEHRHQNGETVDYAQYYQFVLDGHDTKISEEKKQEKCHKRNHKRREYA